MTKDERDISEISKNQPNQSSPVVQSNPEEPVRKPDSKSDSARAQKIRKDILYDAEEEKSFKTKRQHRQSDQTESTIRNIEKSKNLPESSNISEISAQVPSESKVSKEQLTTEKCLNMLNMIYTNLSKNMGSDSPPTIGDLSNMMNISRHDQTVPISDSSSGRSAIPNEVDRLNESLKAKTKECDDLKKALEEKENELQVQTQLNNTLKLELQTERSKRQNGDEMTKHLEQENKKLWDTVSGLKKEQESYKNSIFLTLKTLTSNLGNEETSEHGSSLVRYVFQNDILGLQKEKNQSKSIEETKLDMNKAVLKS
jgi:hypothetical protein